MGQAARRLTVEYGGFALDDTHGIALQGRDERYGFTRGYSTVLFACDFVVRLLSPTGTEATDDAAFAALCAAAEVALSKPRQKLVVKLGGTTIHEIDSTPGSLTAFQTTATVEKSRGKEDTGRTRAYRFTVTAKLPADLSGQGFRRESQTQTVTTIAGRRTCVIVGTWTASDDATAFENYEANGDAFFAARLPTPVTSGEWVLADADPATDDEDSELVVRRTYWEVVDGLREYSVDVQVGPNQVRAVTVSGAYTKTASATAKENHDAHVSGLVTAAMGVVGVTTWDAKPVARREGYGTTTETYGFSRTHVELIYDQGPGGADDPDVVTFSLSVGLRTTLSGDTITGSARPSRIRTGVAVYSAEIDKAQTNLSSIWETRLRAHAAGAIRTKLNAQQAIVVDERLDLDLVNNRITAVLEVAVVGGNVLDLVLSERIVDRTGLRPVPRGDGKRHSYYLFRGPPERRLYRKATCRFLAGTEAPALFAPGDVSSSFLFTDTGRSIEAALEAQEQDPPQIPAPGWLAVAGGPTFTPTTLGEPGAGLDVVLLEQEEEWLYLAAVEVGPTVEAS